MTFSAWLSDTDRRFYPDSPAESRQSLTRDYARNERFSFQVLVREDEGAPRRVTVEAAGPEGWEVRVRRIGYVPVAHANTGAEDAPEEAEVGRGLPGFVPDPLLPDQGLLLARGETHGFWVSVRPAAGAEPGRHAVRVTVSQEGGRPRRLTYTALLHAVSLEPRRDFHITHWFYADSLVAQYGVRAFSEEFWTICERYVADYASHGCDVLYVPAFTPPLDGVKLPTQLLTVTRGADGGWRLDWTRVRRWLAMARRHGITHFEWVHPFTQWGVRFAIRIYEGERQEEERLAFPDGTPATSPEYRAFLAQYCDELHGLLQEEGILETSFFHVSDEPHGDEHKANYRAAREMLRQIAPWMRTMDALTDIAYGREGLTDLPVPSITTAVSFVEEGIPCWCYYCCGPRGRYLNRLLDTPLPKIWMHGVLFYRWPFGGFLHWGYNYWFQSQTRNLVDVYTCQDGRAWPGWAYGDTCVVYPGADGAPVDSLRWEIFGESLQDYQLLQTLGVGRDDPAFHAVRGFSDFPKDSGWRLRLRRRLLKAGDR